VCGGVSSELCDGWALCFVGGGARNGVFFQPICFGLLSSVILGVTQLCLALYCSTSMKMNKTAIQ